MNDIKYSIKPIGVLQASNTNSKLIIYKEYLNALKNLNMFSHIIVMLEQKNLATAEKEYSKKQIYIHTCKVKSIKNCELTLEGSSLFLGDFKVYDIKPYFPCEDRVLDAVSPIYSPDTLATNNISQDENKQNNEVSLKTIGTIIKRNESHLKLPNYSINDLENLSKYSHIRVVWCFSRFKSDRFKRIMQVKPPYENAPKSGVFATRSPVRPNPLAITTTKIMSIDYDNKVVKINAIDAFNNTPIVEVIPYVTERDCVDNAQVPKYLEHWPDHYQDLDGKYVIGSGKLSKPSRSIIEKYSVNSRVNKTEINITEKHVGDRNDNKIVVKGAKQNNLKNIDITIPKDKLTVITGVSGSGKSSVAFDTLYAESQRRFINNIAGTGMSGIMQKPNVDQITGLPPAIAIKQNNTNRNARSTVGTMTDIYNYIRVLFSKIGIRRCPICGRTVEVNTVNDIVKYLINLKPNTSVCIRPFNKDVKKDKLIILPNSDDFKEKLRASIERNLEHGKGAIFVQLNSKDEILMQTKSICYHCNHIMFKMMAADFSFNNPDSMCTTCKGLGEILQVDNSLIVKRENQSILDNASDWWGNLRQHRKKPNANWMRGEILALADELKVDLELPWCDLPDDFKNQALFGSNGKVVTFEYENKNGRRGEISRPVEGAFNAINRLYNEGKGSAEHLASSYMRKKKCYVCNGERLNNTARLVSINGTRFPYVVRMTIEELKEWLSNIYKGITNQEMKIVTPIINEIYSRLQNLINVGVPYLSLDRSVTTLSGGELQRIRLASQLNNGLSNLLYILDEPSMGLHSYDNNKLIDTLLRIRDNGNTVVVVEHDRKTMLASDYIIDVGPGAGIHGGQIVAEGTLNEIMTNKISLTGKYLSQRTNKKESNVRSPYAYITLNGASENNLKEVDVKIPLGVTTCVTGVSGSGKSTLLLETLYPALQRALSISEEPKGKYKELTGVENINNVMRISQSPIGRSPRSNPATYTGLFDHIRDLFSKTDDAKSLGYKKSYFSFNSKDGQCEECRGEGRNCVKMHFMPDLWIECNHCKGQRYKENVLKVKYNNKSISDVLNMDIKEAYDFFNGHSKITSILKTLCEVGLGYLKLGQSANTLSGGEAQRIKLAKELSKQSSGRTVFILDEPTTGLHFDDIQKLTQVFNKIVDEGNTLIIIEHDLSIIENADYIIDIGPYGGDKGGTIVATGTPVQIMNCENSLTGKMLKEAFS